MEEELFNKICRDTRGRPNLEDAYSYLKDSLILKVSEGGKNESQRELDTRLFLLEREYSGGNHLIVHMYISIGKQIGLVEGEVGGYIKRYEKALDEHREKSTILKLPGLA
jgi:hypothetical protein